MPTETLRGACEVMAAARHVLIALWLDTAGTNPIHNKKPKKKATEEDEDDKAFKLKQAAGGP